MLMIWSHFQFHWEQTKLVRAGQVCVQRTIRPTSPRDLESHSEAEHCPGSHIKTNRWSSDYKMVCFQILLLLNIFYFPSNPNQLTAKEKLKSCCMYFRTYLGTTEIVKTSVSGKSSLSCSKHSIYQHQCQQVKVTTFHPMTRAHPRMRMILTWQRNSPFFSTTPGMSTSGTVQSSHLTSRISLWYL